MNIKKAILNWLPFGNSQDDIQPIKPQVKYALSPDLRPKAKLPPQAPRAGAPLRGYLECKAGASSIVIVENESTVELLALTDAHEPNDDDGINPYNTGVFENSGVWKSMRKR